MEYFIRPFKTWNQLDDWVVDSDRVDENRFNNCGPECVAMTTWHMFGVELSADTIKDILYGDKFTGYTTADKLAYFFQRYAYVHADIYANLPFDPLKQIIVDAVMQGHPVIALQYFRRDQPQSGHWVCIIRIDDNGLSVADPYGGLIKHYDWYTFSLWQKGWLVVPRPAFKRTDLSE